jgi:hypothetical protein
MICHSTKKALTNLFFPPSFPFFPKKGLAPEANQNMIPGEGKLTFVRPGRGPMSAQMPPTVRLRHPLIPFLNLFVGLIVGPVVGGVGIWLMTLAIFSDFSGNEQASRWRFILFGLSMLVAAIGFLSILHNGTFWIELGEKVRYRKFLGERVEALSAIQKLEVQTSLSHYPSLILTLTKGVQVTWTLSRGEERQLRTWATFHNLTVRETRR